MKILIATLMASAFANTNAASKFYVCATPQNVELSLSDYELLTWTEIGSIGSRGETGKTTNMLNYPTWDTRVIQKAKGTTDAGSPEIEVARVPTDPGQIILKAASAVGNNNNYAFKEVRADGEIGGTGTVFYNRGLVTGPRKPGGRNEDFDVEIYMLGLQQEEIEVPPTTTGVAPTLTVAPVITGTIEVGETITVNNGTFTGDAVITYTYQWFAGGSAIVGATASSFDITTTQLGKVLMARVTARNASGSAFGFTAPSTAVTA